MKICDYDYSDDYNIFVIDFNWLRLPDDDYSKFALETVIAVVSSEYMFSLHESSYCWKSGFTG